MKKPLSISKVCEELFMLIRYDCEDIRADYDAFAAGWLAGVLNTQLSWYKRYGHLNCKTAKNWCKNMRLFYDAIKPDPCAELLAQKVLKIITAVEDSIKEESDGKTDKQS